MKKIIGIGNALVDVLVVLDNDDLLHEMNLPKGSMQLINESKLQLINRKFAQMDTRCATGGSAGNAMLALANLDAKPGFIGKVGCDEFGAFYAENCKSCGMQAELMVCNDPTGIASTFISCGGERTFATFLGAASLISADDISSDLFEGYHYLFVEGYLVQNHDMIEKTMRAAREKGLKICLDLASYNIVEADLAFFYYLVEQYVDIVFANEDESRVFTDGKEPEEALSVLSQMCELAIVKLGAGGVLVQCGSEVVQEPAIPVDNVLDTTGAGDYFAGGFLYGLSKGCTLSQCARMGSVLGGYVIQSIGTTLPGEIWQEIRLKVDNILGNK